MKLRSRWFLKQTLGLEGGAALALNGSAPPNAPGNEEWQPAGPTNIGGRLTCLVCHPQDPDTLWVGSAGGGVWKSSDAGAHWTMSWKDQETTLNIGALALDPQDPNILYCGTGEPNLSFDSYPGAGLYKSEDGGTTWKLLAPLGQDGPPPRIGVIAIDPFDNTRLLIGGVGSKSSEPRSDLGGLYVSTNSGTSWQRNVRRFPRGDYQCHAIVFHPSRKGWVFATFTEGGSRNGIWLSKDGGDHWDPLDQGLPSADMIHRTSLAIAPSSPNVIYALAADRYSHVLGVFKSTDDGNTWNHAGTPHFSDKVSDERWMAHANTIAVHPQDPDFVICGGVNLHRTRDGGKNWVQVTDFEAHRGDAWYAHADHHALVIPTTRPDRIYDANDGGLDVSEDQGETWHNRSDGLAVTMYYDLDVAPGDSGRFGGGTQDNGTLITLTGDRGDHFRIVPGDGGWMVFDPQDPHHFYASAQYMHIVRWRQGHRQILDDFAEESERNAVWMAFIAMDPGDPNTVYVGTQRIWKTTDDGNTWKAVSPFFDRSNISALEVAPADAQYVYAATEDGGFFWSWDRGSSWSDNLAGAALPKHMITRIETGPDSPENLFVTVAGFGHSHVFRSSDGGWTWDDVDRGQLPNVPFYAAVIPPHQPNTVYVCGDARVFASIDRGNTWMDLTRNLPNVRIVDLVYHEKENTLFAATYGRGLWRLRLS